jgi:uncharacterized protein (DUF58 family)
MSAPGLHATPESVLRRLEWKVIRRLDGRLQGNYRTLLHGSGIDVADLREYQTGDDVRHIDWNVTARTDVVHVRTFMEDRELTAWLLLDRSASMTFGPVDRPKGLVLAEVATTLARVLSRGGNLVGALLYNNGVERTMQPHSDRNHVLYLARELLKPVVSTGTTTKLGDLLDVGAHMIKRRSLVVIVSDFISEDGWERSLRLLTRRHEVVAIRVVDLRETDLPDAGLIVVEDAETGELLSVDTSDPQFRRRYSEATAQREQAIRDKATSAGVDLHTISTDDDLIAALIRIVALRRKRRL